MDNKIQQGGMGMTPTLPIKEKTSETTEHNNI